MSLLYCGRGRQVLHSMLSRSLWISVHGFSTFKFYWRRICYLNWVCKEIPYAHKFSSNLFTETSSEVSGIGFKYGFGRAGFFMSAAIFKARICNFYE